MSQSWGFAGRTALVLFAVAGSVGCSRTPPEPAPPSTSTTNSSPSIVVSTDAARAQAVLPAGPAGPAASAKPGRCITPVAADAPALPPVASPTACPKDPDGIPKSASGVVTFPDAPNAPKVDVELAVSEKEITRGLMYRRTMPEEHGMLFKLDERREHTFWMHNTCMPLDMLFIDDDGTVVGIVESATPLTDSPRTVGCPSVFVLEVNAGWCRRHGVKPGQKLGMPANAR